LPDFADPTKTKEHVKVGVGFVGDGNTCGEDCHQACYA
jgi:hypothetical protein